jgi:hypothetical protein
MKTILFTLLNIISLAAFGQAQCTFENIFPVRHGISKFKATTTIASIKNIKEDEEANKYSGIFNSWDKPDYLKGDSVFKSSISYNYIYHDCFKGDKNELYLHFVDDKLYKIQITLTFSNTKFGKCMENYNTLVAIFKNYFITWTECVKSNDVTKEQIGEGYWFYPTTMDKSDAIKLNDLSIGYEVKYEMKWSDYKKEWYRTGNVDKYVIEIEYINLKGTKLTNEGY